MGFIDAFSWKATAFYLLAKFSKLGKIILTARQFAGRPSLNETPETLTVNGTIIRKKVIVYELVFSQGAAY